MRRLTCGVNSMKWFRHWRRSGLWGTVALLLVNAVGAFSGITLGYSWLCVAAATLFGLPGVTALLLMNVIIGI